MPPPVATTALVYEHSSCSTCRNIHTTNNKRAVSAGGQDGHLVCGIVHWDPPREDLRMSLPSALPSGSGGCLGVGTVQCVRLERGRRCVNCEISRTTKIAVADDLSEGSANRIRELFRYERQQKQTTLLALNTLFGYTLFNGVCEQSVMSLEWWILRKLSDHFGVLLVVLGFGYQYQSWRISWCEGCVAHTDPQRRGCSPRGNEWHE